MAFKFANIAAAMKMVTGQETVTEAHLQAADDKIAQLELDKKTADDTLATVQGQLTTAQAELKTATDKITTTEASLATANEKVATLEQWKKNQAAADGRTEDDSNNLDEDKGEPKAGFEVAAAAVVARTKQRLGEK